MGIECTGAPERTRGVNRYAARSMALDPRTPVVVGVGQVATPSDAGLEPAARPEPLALMTAALLAATEDCDGVPAGGKAPAGRALLERADSIRVVASLGWSTPDPARLVATRLGFAEGEEPAELMVSSIGGNSPQAFMHDACLGISRGERDVVLVTGAEAMYARALARRDPARPWLQWATQPEGTPPAALFGVEKAGATELEMQRGVILPVHAYPLLENALRAANGWTLQEHAARIGSLWSRFSEVAAANPHAWIRTARRPEEIIAPGPTNRMISFPYPKLCTANMQVDQGAGFIVCSVEAARAAGVPEERWVFPLSGADGNDHWFLSERPELHRSPAIRIAGGAALAQAALGVDDIAFVDLYSCFPAVVQMAAAELGLGLGDPDRPLTLTGGLTFGGGPGNNYASHGIAQAVGALREAPGSAALVSGLGWYATKHSLGVYASRPPDHAGGQPFAWRDVQPEIDALPRCAVDAGATGPVRVETYAVTFDRDGAPERGILACRTAAGSRAWANASDPDALALLCAEEGIGRTGDLAPDGTLTLTG
jgi:acetyl-CoA C-acetyltransferase